MSSKKLKSRKWERSVLCRPVDNFQIGFENKRLFFPSYINEGRPNLNWLMKNEYQRRWFAEKEVLYDQRFYPKYTTREIIGRDPNLKMKKSLTTKKVLCNRTKPPPSSL